MFGWLFKRTTQLPVRPMLRHPNLGQLQYDARTSQWESTEGAEIYFGGIPGSADGPSSEQVQELLARLNNLDRYWEICSKDLIEISSTWESLPKVEDPREIFSVAALSLYASHWEICFQSKPEYKWLYVGMQFEGDLLVSNTIDT
ncbi:MAG: hypothetical protein V4673_06280 [Pseudomonadota bacterium]